MGSTRPGADALRLRARLLAYYEARSRFDAEAVVTAFSAGATVEDPIGSPPLHGRDDLRRAIWSAGRVFVRWARTPGEIVLVGTDAAVSWTAELLSHDGRRASFTGIDVFELDDLGAIRSLRSYWDPATAGALLSDG